MNRKSLITINHKEKGIVLVEAIVALALIGLIAVGFLGAIGTSYKSTALSVEMTTSESLARSQMESIKQQDYSEAGVYDEIDHPAYYSINWTVQLNPGEESGEYIEQIQKITITVTHTGEDALVLEGYKVNR